MKILTKYSGFTLAEVLITLGVIGVVAAMTLPTLIQNYQKQVTVTQLKKAYSEFSQAIQKAEVEHGLMETWDFNATNFNNNYAEQNKNFGENYLLPHIKTVKQCIPTSNECWADDIVNLNKQSLATEYGTNNLAGASSFITASGYSAYYWLHTNGTGMWYYVDINGNKKGPNQIGRDIFAFCLNWGKTTLKKGVSPAGLHTGENCTRDDLLGRTNSCNYTDLSIICKKQNSTERLGLVCTGVIMMDGWKIEKDYPW